MKALVMAGGRSTRFGGGEKPMALLRGKPLIGWVVDALERGFAGPVAVAASPRTPRTARWARSRGLEVVETPGRGFVEDAALAARRLGLPLLVVAADLPLLPPGVVAGAIRRHGETHRSLSVWVTARPATQPHLTVEREGRGPRRPGDPLAQDGLAPAGVNIWASGEEERWVVHNPGLARNVNTIGQLLQTREALDAPHSEKGPKPVTLSQNRF